MTTPNDAAPIVREVLYCSNCADMGAKLSAERLARAEVERTLREESATLSAIRRRHDLCGSCDGLNCAHLWPDKKCCPDCDHERPEAAKAAGGEVEQAARPGYYGPVGDEPQIRDLELELSQEKAEVARLGRELGARNSRPEALKGKP